LKGTSLTASSAPKYTQKFIHLRFFEVFKIINFVSVKAKTQGIWVIFPSILAMNEEKFIF